MKKEVIVIGAGFSGLSAACVLADKGFNVRVLEKNAIAGGRARKLEEEGFLFDMGPSWYWLPDVLERFFNRFGKSASDYYKLVRVDPSYKVFYGPEDSVNIPAGKENVMKVFEKMEPGAGKMLHRYLDEAAFKYKIGVNELVYRPAKTPFEFMEWEVIKGSLKLHVFHSFHNYVRKYFKNPRLWPILEFPVIFLGATPRRAPALYSLMNHADIALGTWYPMGGMFEVIKGFEALAKSLGVAFSYNAPVERIEVKNGQAKGVVVNGEVLPADYIVASADYHHVEQQLLPEPSRRYTPRYWDKREMAPSSLIFYLGVDKKLEGLEHHNLFFDRDFRKHAHELFEEPVWPSDPLMYISVTSKTDSSVSPEGMENLMVLIPVAPGLEDNETTRELYFRQVVERLRLLTGEDLDKHLVYKRSYAHKDFSKYYNAYKGNAYGLGNTLMQTAFMKPKMHSKKVGNLLYAGQLTTPGPGMPPSIISGQVAAEEIVKLETSLKQSG